MFLIGISAEATTLEVPQTYPTIQGAIDASQDGDVIRIQPGTYEENINFMGKAITVTGTAPENWETVRATVIHGGRQTSAVVFNHQETADAVLTGLTVTGIGGMRFDGDNGDFEIWGFGACCFRADPTIRACIFRESMMIFSRGQQSGDVLGGGIGCLEASPVIERNIFTANRATYGGGICTVRGEPQIRSNWIHHNTAEAGGGLLLLSGHAVNNTVVYNDASNAGGNILVVPDQGTFTIHHNIFANALRGGGVFWDNYFPQPGVFSYNNVWGNHGGDYVWMPEFTGIDGNISADPQFEDVIDMDLRIKADSPCIDAGDRAYAALSQVDIMGAQRHVGETVDLGAHEYPECRNRARAGNDQFYNRPQVVTLDGSDSYFCDPNQASFTWIQIGGPDVTVSDVHDMTPTFEPVQYGEYIFQLTVGNASQTGTTDQIRVVIKNHVPVADAGSRQSTPLVPATIRLDGSASSDADGDNLVYQWQQLSGPMVELSSDQEVTPNFVAQEEGDYVFSLVVFDGVAYSDVVQTEVVIGNSVPVADAGLSVYLIEGSAQLDGSGSYDPDTGDASNLIYQWAQISGDPLPVTGTDTAILTVPDLPLSNQIQRYTFELVVHDGQHVSNPDTVDLVVVENPGGQTLTLHNPPFDPNKPTIVAFAGGNCNTGGAFRFNDDPLWIENANLVTSVGDYGPPYYLYADYLITYLAAQAPNYTQPIQTQGFSTGAMVAMEIARRLNTVYGDPRYTIQRVAFLDAGCHFYGYPEIIELLHTQGLTGQPFWVENYYSTARYFNNTLNIRFPTPPADHHMPRNWYGDSQQSNWWPDGDMYNDGIMGGYYLSVAGPGKNMRIADDPTPYFFEWVPGDQQYLIPFDETRFPGRLPEPVTLLAPTHSDDQPGLVLSCESSRNAVTYELLLGDKPAPVDEYTVAATSDTPLQVVLTELPYAVTWWTVRVQDAHGSTIYADPQPLSAAAFDMVYYE